MDRMVAEGDTGTAGDRTEAEAGILVAGILVAGILARGISAAGPAAGDILALDILEEGTLTAGTLVAAVLVAVVVGVALFRVGSVLHIEGTAGLTVEDPDRFIRGNL
jgi:hypothetical protein